jgi:hypothetical protein
MYARGELSQLWRVASETDLSMNLVTAMVCVSVLAAALLGLYLVQGRPVYLVDFAVYRPPDSWKWSRQFHAQCTEACQVGRQGCSGGVGLPGQQGGGEGMCKVEDGEGAHVGVDVWRGSSGRTWG